MRHKNPYCLVENNGFEPFAPACKAGVLAKYTNPPNIILQSLKDYESSSCVFALRQRALQ